jgi:predicted patatin/cPLA2 family phospholipase
MKKRALVVSGGGSRGAFGGGLVENLIKLKNKEWDIFIGTSTGSLLVPLISIKEIDKLKEKYTSVTNKDIFNIRPFKQNGKVKICNLLMRVITGKTSIGQGKNLRKNIEHIFTKKDFNKSIELGKEINITVGNITTANSEYKSQNECKYEDFCDWMLASCSVPIAFEVIKKDEYEYLDGGIYDNVPIQRAIDLGAEEIDVIILSEKNKDMSKWKSKNIFNVMFRILDILSLGVTRNDIQLGKLEGELKNININYYYLPDNFDVGAGTVVFDPVVMKKWWTMGYNFDLNKDGNKKTLYDLNKENIVIKYNLKKSDNGGYIVRKKWSK